MISGFIFTTQKWETIQTLNVLTKLKTKCRKIKTVDADTPIFTQPGSENYHRLCQFISQTATGPA